MEIIYKPNPLDFEVGDRIVITNDTFSPKIVGRTGIIKEIKDQNQDGDWEIILQIDGIGSKYGFQYVVYLGNYGDEMEKI